MDLTTLYTYVGNSCYIFLALNALWGAYCGVMVLSRIARKRFRDERQVQQFLESLDPPLSRGDFEGAIQVCDGDDRAVPQLVMLAIENRKSGYAKAKQLVMDRFHQDVIVDLENRLAWVVMMIKTAPMLGLYGTVLGMMGAFGKLAAAENVKPAALASDISLALLTTAMGLTIAIPLMILVASINIRLRKMEELASLAFARFFESFQMGLGLKPKAGR